MSTEERFKIIAGMLRRAEAYGLQVEVIDAFDKARRDGYSLILASELALAEWDIPTV